MILLDPTQHFSLLALEPNQSQIFSIGEQHFLALNHLGRLYIYRNNCPHLNKRLANASFHCFDETFSLIECQFHGAQFLPESGKCVSGPCVNEKLEKFILQNSESCIYLVKTDI